MSRGDAARFFLALADETRLAILDELRGGERSVSELVAALDCPQPKVSRHLKVLKEAGLVSDRRDGRRVIYARAGREAWSEAAREWVTRLGAVHGASGHAHGRAAGTEPDDRPSPPAAHVRRGGDLETHLL